MNWFLNNLFCRITLSRYKLGMVYEFMSVKGQDTLLEILRLYKTEDEIASVVKAIGYAKKAHENQIRASGEPYINHPVAVAIILAEMKMDIASIITAILHDTVEDTPVTLEDLQKEFGQEISKLVDGVTKLTKIEYQPDYTRQAENFRKLFVALSEDIRVLLVKLADRTHNMRTINHLQPDKQRRIALETMEIYAPLAERIGIQKFKTELQDICFSVLHAEARQSIVNRLDYLRKTGRMLVKDTVEHLQKTLDDHKIPCKVAGREKTPCSIWQKMERKSVSFEQLADIVAFRIVTENVEDCYRVLGVIHANYQMVPESFKDFISTPKINGYQSLHTVVIGPKQQPIEIQIRTEEMHEIAELGVAAHWIYKQSGTDEEAYAKAGHQFRWIRELVSILEHSMEAEEFLENTKMEMYYDQVFCFTPKGNLIALPRGATPVDFAYAVHSKVGHTCVGAKVNSRIVPLKTELRNGDQVEIITSKTQVPSPSWEKFVITGKARSSIKRFVRSQERKEYLQLGKAMVQKVFQQEHATFDENRIIQELKNLGKKSCEDLYIAVGNGTVQRTEVQKVLFGGHTPSSPLKNRFSFLQFKKTPKKEEDSNAIPIKGLIPGMAMHFAGCCHPLPGDRIVGIVHTGKGVTIHTSDCEMLENFSSTPERWIEVSWEKECHDETHVGRMKVILTHEAGSLAMLATTVAQESGNITNLKIITRSTDFFEMLVDVEVRGINHLSAIMSILRTKPGIHSVERYRV